MSLFDRSYMRPEQPRGGKPDDGSSMIWSLLLANVLVYLLFSSEVATLALSWGGLRGFKVYQLVTAGFFHQDFSHIFFNMWGLYLFGKLVAPHLGSARFLILYLIGVVSGNLLFLLFNWNSTVPVIGASGAIAGVMGAYFRLFPRARVVTLIPIIIIPWIVELPAVVFLGIWFAVQLFSGLSGSLSMGGAGEVAFWAHVGGFAAGLFLVRRFLPLGCRYCFDPRQRRYDRETP